MTKRKKIYSFRDKNGVLFVNCAECERGGNGKLHNCSCGWNIKGGHYGQGCCAGTLLENITEERLGRQDLTWRLK
ncbi:MAG: hypothetical protein IKZ46_02295 [Victivallales bacterium]|jgi:hypothetical protein|nr:hypothetical protein [Victivallales bacterium]